MKKSIFSRALDKLKRANDDQPKAGGDLKSHIERRRHQRFDLAAFRCVEAVLPDGSTTVIHDLSYGGFSAVRTTSTSIIFGTTLPIKLQVLGLSCDAEISITHMGETTFGCCFVHATPETLIFLRPILEDMRCGASCVELAKELTKEKYQGSGWAVMRGEGPTDLLMQSSIDGKTLVEGHLTFRQDEHYLTVSHANGKSQYSGSIDAQGSAVRMTAINPPEAKDVRQAIQVLLGAYTQSKLTCLEYWIGLEIERLSHLLQGSRKVS